MNNNLTVVVVFSLIFSSFIGYLATRRGRSFLNWFIISILATPLLALIILFILKSRTIVIECPSCAYTVKSNESICKNCNHGLSTDERFIKSVSSALEQKSNKKIKEEMNRIAEEGDKAFQAGVLRSSNPYRSPTAVIENQKHIEYWDRGYTVAENRKNKS